jgi:stearoyl-CoA 9-desaturase NADPH oxidoreductase
MSVSFQNKLHLFLTQALFNTSSARSYFEPMAEKWLPAYSLLSPKAKVVELIQEREDLLHVYLRPNLMWRGFKAGQYVELGVEIDGSLQKRIFSISSSEQLFRSKGLIRLSIQKQDKGLLTPFLFQHLRLGDYVHISRAAGSFTLPVDGQKGVLLIAGGVGITPLISMISSIRDIKNLTPITLLYYANQKKQHILQNELNELGEVANIILIHTERTGRFSLEHLHDFCPDFLDRMILVCGPSALDNHVNNLLKEQGVSSAHTQSESFSVQPIWAPSHGLVEEVRISLSRSFQEFKAANNKSILEILESKGLRPRFGCRMGICNECSCKKISGTVMNRKDNTLSHAGEEFIRICSAIPAGDLVLEF